MEIVKVEIRKRKSYENYPNEIAGIVQLNSENGWQEVKLSASVPEIQAKWALFREAGLRKLEGQTEPKPEKKTVEIRRVR